MHTSGRDPRAIVLRLWRIGLVDLIHQVRESMNYDEFRATETRGRRRMSENAAKAYELTKQIEGKEEGTGDWFEITQDAVNQFADVTHDHQFIHVDPERAKETPFGGPIAHGFLTLSLLSHLATSAMPEKVDPRRYEGMIMGVNYGFEKVRFVSPVPVGSRIRVHRAVTKVELKGNAVQQTITMTVEIEGGERPALVADWLTRIVYS